MLSRSGTNNRLPAIQYVRIMKLITARLRHQKFKFSLKMEYFFFIGAAFSERFLGFPAKEEHAYLVRPEPFSTFR